MAHQNGPSKWPIKNLINCGGDEDHNEETVIARTSDEKIRSCPDTLNSHSGRK